MLSVQDLIVATHIISIRLDTSQTAHLLMNLPSCRPLVDGLNQHTGYKTPYFLRIIRVARHFVLNVEYGERALFFERRSIEAELIEQNAKSPYICAVKSAMLQR